MSAEDAVLLAVPEVEAAALVELAEAAEADAETTGGGTAPPGPRTTRVCVVDAVSPYAPTVPIIRRTWVPKSSAPGVHEKSPDELMLLFVRDDFVPVNVSMTEKVVGQYPCAPAAKVTVWPGVILPVGARS